MNMKSIITAMLALIAIVAYAQQRLNIFTGKKHDGQSKIYGEYDIHKLSSSEMIWYRTDSNDELARFKKIM